MNLKRLHLKGFTKHKDTIVTFPARGIMLVTGPNGAGKSSLIEGPATAGWGDTLRGTPPWAEKGGSVFMETDKVEVTRSKSEGGRQKVIWSTNGQQPIEYEANMKAQEALEEQIGSFPVWRRTSVFSSQDAANFTLSTDGERKRLLEMLLGLDRFDPALERCKADYKLAEQQGHKALSQFQEAEAQVTRVRALIGEVEKTIGILPPSSPEVLDALTKKRKQAETFYLDTTRERDELVQETNRLSRNLGAQESDLKRVEAKAKKLLESTMACPECEQPLSESYCTAMKEELEEDRKSFEALKKDVEGRVLQNAKDLVDLKNQADKFADQFKQASREYDAARDAARIREVHEGRIDKLKKELEEATENSSVRRRHVEEATVALGELGACVTVLGLKGVRAHVLGKSLAGLEAVANNWLARVAGTGLKLKLNPYTEKKTGGVSDSIALEVHGAGGGHGYKGASGGERRRIDVALLLALAEIAQAARGGEKGTLFFDEVLDTLDSDGVDRAVQALGDLSKDRCIVLITHNPALVQRVPAAVHLSVNEGTVASA